MIIRTAVETDASAVCAIWNYYIRDTLVTFNPVEKTPDDVRQMITDRHAFGYGFFVLEISGTVRGFATYSQFRGGVGYAKTMEHTILLDKGATGTGGGGMLMDRIFSHARNQGVVSIFAGVSAANLNGVAFHKAIGFQHVARLERVGHKFEQALDLVLMQKFL